MYIIFSSPYSYLQSKFGGNKSAQQAKEQAVDLSEFLYNANHPQPEEPDILLVSKISAIESYVQLLEKLKLGPSGICSKLNMVTHAQLYLLHRYIIATTE